MKGKVVVITGASSGIGLATAWEFARNGASVVLASRNMDLLSDIENQMKQAGYELDRTETFLVTNNIYIFNVAVAE